MNTSFLSLILLLLVLTGTTTIYAGTLLDDAEALIRQGQSQRAYELLHTVFEKHAGDPDFDYLFGLAAMDSGHPTEAVFAFERILDAQPGHTEARIELARAYYQLNEYRASQQEFETVRERVPAAVQSTIDKFLAAIQHASAPAQRQFHAYIDVGAGYDSNVNGATDTPTFLLGGFGNIPITLDDSGLEKSSMVTSLDAGFSFEEPTSEDTSIYVRGYVSADHPLQESDFSTESVGGELGYLMFLNDDRFRVGVTGMRYLIDEHSNFNQGGLKTSWQHALNSNTRVTLNGQYLAIRYIDQGARDVNVASAGVSYTRALERQGNPVIFASISGGNEDEQDSSRPDLGRDYYGISSGFLYTVQPNMTLITTLGWQRSRYAARDPLFANTRKDELYSASTGLIIDLGEDWDVRPSLKYTRNDSNLPVNDFSRWQAHLNLKRTF